VDLFYPAGAAEPALRGWRDLIPDAPRQATFTAWVGTCGEWPHVPAELHGRPVASAGYVWVGDPAEGRRLLPALRAAGSPAVSPVAERIQELTYLELQRMDDSDQNHAVRRYWKGHYLPAFPDEAIRAFLARGADGSDDADAGYLPGASLQSYGGAIAEVPDGASAFSQRGTFVEFVAAARWTDPAQDARRMAVARRYAATLDRFASGAYVNVLSDEGQEGVRRAYPAAKLARLTALKDRYDPENVFHLNQNIRPSGWRPAA